MTKTSSTKKTTRSPVTGPNSSAHETLIAVPVEGQVSPFSVSAEKSMTSQSAWHDNWAKKMESAQEWKAHMATEVTVNAAKAIAKEAAKTSQQEQSNQNQVGKTMTTSASMGATVIDC